MYSVSAAYKTAIGQNVRDVRITGTITLKDNSVINITDEDIVQGSLYITEQCVAGEDIEVGNVYASEMGLSLRMPLENPYSLDGARIIINFGINVETDPDEPPIWEYVPLGYFYVTEIQRKANNVNLTALDGMLLFDIPVGDPGSSSPRNFVVYACEQAGVPLGTSVFEIDTFANATLLFAAPDASKIKTCRDLLMWACQIMGAFARMNRSGELEIVPIKARPSVKTINKAERFNSDVSDFAVKITKVSMQVGETVYSRGTDGMTMVLDENPLMTGLSESQINAVLDNLLAQITTAVYVPFNSNFIGDPALQPGDFVTLSDTSVLGGGDVASIITHSTWRYRGPHNIKGAGKHGLVRGVQNQQMKAVSSIVAIARAAQNLATAANQSTQLIKDAIGGHVLIRQAPNGNGNNEILIMDHPDPDQAVKIWRWNMGGLGYSDNCIGADNPEREYDIAMTMDGAINANFVKTGRLDAGVVTIGPQTTFAPGYDPTQIVAGSAVGMGVDDNCVGLWHFDGSLNSHKGVTVESNADYNTGIFGQALNIATGKHLKVPAAGMSASQGTINFRAKSLANSPNNSVLIEVPQPDNSQGIKSGIASDGRLYVQDLPFLFKYVETTQADFNTGTLTDVVATSAGDLQLATGKKLGTREKVIDLSSVGANNYGSIINFTKTDAVITNATFIRASVAYLEDGTQVPAGQPRFEPGKFGQAVLIEEGTTNLANNPLFSGTIGRAPTGWHNHVTIQQDDFFGNIINVAELLCVPGVPYENFGVGIGYSLEYNTTYTISFWARGTLDITFDYWNRGIDSVVYVSRPPINLEWQKYELRITTSSSGTIYPFWWFLYNINDVNVGKWARIAFVQLEKKPRATSFTDGTRQPERLHIPTKGIINSQEGTISVRATFSPLEHSPTGWRHLWDTTGLRFAVVWNPSRQIEVRRNGVTVLSFDKPVDFDETEWHTYTIRWSLTETSLFVDGVLWEKVSGTFPELTPGDFLTLGTRFELAGYEASGLFDELAIFDYAATDEEIQAWYESNQPISFKKGCTYKMNFDNNLQATVGSVDIEVALSVDGGDNYGQYSEVKSGLSIPGLTGDTDLTNGRLKIKETLYTSDVSVTPKLHDLGFNITIKLPTTVYSSNKSGLTAWDSISLAWKPERLSLVVNDEEVCFIENPGLPTALGSHIYIGTDRNGANAINTLVDELRIDKVYREVNIRTGWHKTGVPFYTSEDMKQWPGYMKLETDGLKVYDSQDQLRVLLGSWLKDAVRKYGIKIIDGEIYSTVIQSGEEGATSYVRIGSAWEPLKVVENGKLALNIWSYGGGLLQFYDTYLDNMAGQILPMNDALGQGLKIHGRNNAGQLRDVALQGRNIRLDSQQLIDLSTNTDGWISIDAGGGFITANGSLTVYGSISKTGSLNYIEPTKDYGIRLLNAVEAPELKYVDMGRAQLQNGEAIVYLDPILLQCIEPDTELTPWLFKTEVYGEGEDIRVIEWGENYFRVKECNGGRSNRMFGWWFYATRINYAGIRLQEYVGVV